MKKLLFTLVFIISILFATKETKAFSFGVDFDFFYTSLHPHGNWLEIDNGLIVWRPRISFSNWAPYSRGNWIWTNQGWYWDSYEPFGFIVYHYGRWYFDEYYGWIWIPDYQWAPAWVEWRYSDDYIGWAPLNPYANFSISVGIVFTRSFVLHHNHWHFVRINNFCSPNLSNYFVSNRYKSRIYNRTRFRNDSYSYDNRFGVINRGVERDFVERRGNVRVREMEIVKRERDNFRGEDAVRKTRDRIEISTPRNVEANRRDRDFSIDRSERRSSLEIGKVEVGRTAREEIRRDRTSETRENNSVPQDRSVRRRETNETEVRDNQPQRRKDVDGNSSGNNSRRKDVDNERRNEPQQMRETDRSNVQEPERKENRMTLPKTEREASQRERKIEEQRETKEKRSEQRSESLREEVKTEPRKENRERRSEQQREPVREERKIEQRKNVDEAPPSREERSNNRTRENSSERKLKERR